MRGLRALAAAVALAAGASAQPVDSLAAPTPLPPAVVVGADTVATRSPGGAVLRALAVPGWGQAYNGQWLKAPVAAGGVAAAAVFLAGRQSRYLRYRRAALVQGCIDTPTTSDPDRPALCADAIAAYQGVLDELNAARGQPISLGQLQSVRDQFRGQRDIGVVVVALAYAVQALDAYVIAELADFDVSEDLSVRVRPAAQGATLSLRARL